MVSAVIGASEFIPTGAPPRRARPIGQGSPSDLDNSLPALIQLLRSYENSRSSSTTLCPTLDLVDGSRAPATSERSHEVHMGAWATRFPM